MSIRNASIRAAALGIAAAALTGAVGADPTSDESARAKRSKPACEIVERPKHTIRKCRCDQDVLSGIASIDGAEIIRLLIGSSSCRLR